MTASVFLERGIKVYLYRKLVATPHVPFCLDRHGCAAGVMVTASHNPKEDNGYKVYWSNGAQIVPPHDAGIARCIDTNLAPWTTHGNAQELLEQRQELLAGGAGDGAGGESKATDALLIDPEADATLDAYFAKVASSLCRFHDRNAASELKIVYTAMHGVGFPYTSRTLAEFGFANVFPVDSQCQPDPTFPTVTFPNPEEKGALAEAQRVGDACGAHLVLANDPDADRLAVAEKNGGEAGWRVFGGDEIGILLAWWQWEMYQHECKAAGKEVRPEKVAMVSSTVSSEMLRAFAKQRECAGRCGVCRAEFVYGGAVVRWCGGAVVRVQGCGKCVCMFMWLCGCIVL